MWQLRKVKAAFLPSSLSEFKNDKYTNLGNPGQPNYDNLAKAKPEVIFTSFRQAHTKTLDEIKKLPLTLKYYL